MPPLLLTYFAQGFQIAKLGSTKSSCALLHSYLLKGLWITKMNIITYVCHTGMTIPRIFFSFRPPFKSWRPVYIWNNQLTSEQCLHQFCLTYQLTSTANPAQFHKLWLNWLCPPGLPGFSSYFQHGFVS